MHLFGDRDVEPNHIGLHLQDGAARRHGIIARAPQRTQTAWTRTSGAKPCTREHKAETLRTGQPCATMRAADSSSERICMRLCASACGCAHLHAARPAERLSPSQETAALQCVAAQRAHRRGQLYVALAEGTDGGAHGA
eukprot:200922-Pleurochrysis_carterae.AAC.3